MSRTIQVSALNIAMYEPHSAQAYVDLLKVAVRRKRTFEQGDARAIMLGVLYGSDKGVETNEVQGEIFRFIKVDPSEPWFNTQEHRQATDEELAQVQIPPHLQMNMRRIPFIFYPREHELWFVAKDGKNSLGPKFAERFFQRLVDDVVQAKNLQPVNVTAIPYRDSITRLMRIHRLSKITMRFKRPNPDDAEDIATRIVQRMERENLMSLQEVLTAPRGQAVQPDETTLAYAKVAAKNGRVDVHGYDENGLTVDRSTVDMPMMVPIAMNDEIETTIDALRRAKERD